jgi:pimeloyl-ACP methyl ester carboxylesterase
MIPIKTLLASSDLRGFSQLGFAAAVGLTDLVEQMHRTISRAPLPFGAPVQEPTSGVTGLVYHGIRGAMRLTGGGIDAALAFLGPRPQTAPPSLRRDAALAALNGVLGDHLVESDNPLALSMQLRHEGRNLLLDRQSLSVAIPRPSERLLVLVHGLCLSDTQWTRKGHDHGASLAQEFGFTPVYLYYNTGLHVSANGRLFASLLDDLIAQWPAPIEDLVIIGHSMGGLVARSACHYGDAAGHCWRRRLRKLVFLGTPHHGAPLERAGNWIESVVGMSPYMAAFTRIGKIRSAGITDLRYGNLVDEDWDGRDRFAHKNDSRSKVHLPEDVACYAIAGTTAQEAGGLSDRLVGDGLVPVASALGQHPNAARALPIPEERQWIGRGMSHLDLLCRSDVYERIAGWLKP